MKIKPKQTCKLVVRLPEYIEPEQFKVKVNNAPMKPSFKGRWAHLGTVKKNAIATVMFPMPLREKRVTVGGVDYTLTIKGNVAVDCQPRGRRYPFFVHPEYMSMTVPYGKLPFLDGARKIITVPKSARSE